MSGVLPIRLTQHRPVCCGGLSGERRRVPRPDFPKTLAEFQMRFSTEDACRRYLTESRWPDGVSVSSVQTCGGLSGGARGAAAVPGMPLPGLGYGRDCDASDARGTARGVDPVRWRVNCFRDRHCTTTEGIHSTQGIDRRS